MNKLTQTPNCPYFGMCGGCTLWQDPYEKQLARKKEQVQSLFKIPILSIYSQTPVGYRNRMDFVFTQKGIGLRKKGKWNVTIPINSCAISNKKLNILLGEIQKWIISSKISPFNLKTQIGTMKYAVIRAPENTNSSTITFILNSDSQDLEIHKQMIADFAQVSSAQNILLGVIPATSDVSTVLEPTAIFGTTILHEKLGSKTIYYSSQAFFQNNTFMAEKMINYCKTIIPQSTETLIDLYGGAGTFGISLAELFHKTIIIDNDPGNVVCARKNIAENKINGEALCADAQIIAQYSLKNTTIIVDPPRIGLNPTVISTLQKNLPKKIIYISCNPKTMARDISQLNNYQLKSIAVFDLFPQTEHIECIGELILK